MTTYSIDSDTLPLTLDFEGKKLGMVKVRGRFTQTSGEVFFDKHHLDTSFFDLTIIVGSLNTKNTKRDQHLLGRDFLDEENYESITFRSITIKNALEGFSTTGDLTIKAITQRIDIHFQESNNATLYGVFTIDRKKFDVGSNFPGVIIGTSILIEFSLGTNKN
ncbi:MAG: YceI family protein [Bacteroidota bacterium]